MTNQRAKTQGRCSCGCSQQWSHVSFVQLPFWFPFPLHALPMLDFQVLCSVNASRIRAPHNLVSLANRCPIILLSKTTLGPSLLLLHSRAPCLMPGACHIKTDYCDEDLGVWQLSPDPSPGGVRTPAHERRGKMKAYWHGT